MFFHLFAIGRLRRLAAKRNAAAARQEFFARFSAFEVAAVEGVYTDLQELFAYKGFPLLLSDVEGAPFDTDAGNLENFFEENDLVPGPTRIEDLAQNLLECRTAKLHYEWHKRGDQTIVLLHGLQGCIETFRELMSDSAFSNYSILAIDFLGFGKSPKPVGFNYDLAAQALAVERLVERLGIGRYVVVGHSMGGTIATMLMQRRPESVVGLVNMEGNLCLEDSTFAKTLAALPDDQATLFYQKMRQELRADTRSSAQLRYARTELIPSWVVYRSALSIVRWGETKRALKWFEQGAIPRLLLIGEQGKFVSRPKGEGIEIATIPQAGHFMLADQYATTTAKVSGFLTGLRW